MATQKQKQVLKDLSENIGKSVGTAMRDAGYSESTSRTPKRLTDRIGWKELVDEYLPERELLQVHRELLRNEEWRARDAALDKSYRLKGKYAPIRLMSEPDALEDLSDEELNRQLKEAEEALRKRR